MLTTAIAPGKDNHQNDGYGNDPSPYQPQRDFIRVTSDGRLVLPPPESRPELRVRDKTES